jgi:hypothetical protein
LAFVLSTVFLLSARSTADQNPFKVFVGDKNTSYQTFKDPAGRFELEYPTKDWRLLPSGGSSLAVFARNDGPALFVDHTRIVERLTPGEFERLPEVEVERLKREHPNAKEFKSDRLDTKAGRGVLIRYSRIDGQPQAVVQYLIALDQDLYRLNGVAPERLFSKYEPIIMHMIQSFKAPASPSSSKN